MKSDLFKVIKAIAAFHWVWRRFRTCRKVRISSEIRKNRPFFYRCRKMTFLPLNRRFLDGFSNFFFPWAANFKPHRMAMRFCRIFENLEQNFCRIWKRRNRFFHDFFWHFWLFFFKILVGKIEIFLKNNKIFRKFSKFSTCRIFKHALVFIKMN